jgi:hypothetical protein
MNFNEAASWTYVAHIGHMVGTYLTESLLSSWSTANFGYGYLQGCSEVSNKYPSIGCLRKHRQWARRDHSHEHQTIPIHHIMIEPRWQNSVGMRTSQLLACTDLHDRWISFATFYKLIEAQLAIIAQIHIPKDLIHPLPVCLLISDIFPTWKIHCLTFSGVSSSFTVGPAILYID